METLTFQPPLLGESRAIDALREFIVCVSLRSEPVLLTGPAGSGKSLTAGKIHAIGPNATTPCCCVDGEGLTSEEFSQTFEARIADGGPGSVYVRNADRLDHETAQTIARAICREQWSPRLLFSSREDLDSPAWGVVREAGLLSLITRTHRAIPPLSERPEDVPILCRYQVWLHTLPERFEEEWGEFESQELPALIEQPWQGNVTELIEFLTEYCGGDAITPRRWAGDVGRSTAQEEFIRKELEEAFDDVLALLAEEELGGESFILPHESRPSTTLGD